MSKVTFGYIVGGDDKHYINLMRSLKALEERVKQPYEVVIIDMDDRFYADDANIKIVKQDAKHLQGSGRNWFQPHIWAKRYELYKHVETDYCFYMDVDTVLINDRVDELIEESEDNFMLTQHWWVPTLDEFMKNVRADFRKVSKYLPHSGVDYFYGASGCFLFKKDAHDHIFEKFHEIYTDVHGDGSTPLNVTDELLLCLSFNRFDDWKFTNGAFNHTAAHALMPLKKENGIWMGKNPYEKEFKPVFVFHSSYENVHTLVEHSPKYIDGIKEVMYWEEYHP
jgi:hypothetical protein